MKSIEAYGYIVTGPDYWIDEIEEALENRTIRWNWFLFENGDVVYDNRCVLHKDYRRKPDRR